MSVADKPSEYLKRTCLICGCNTNQTINIYEPRSGPNIVELIQAKFKFQPLNEDKYLCFSCNNWLINWHSLQANNSNDAESPSGTFRSSQVNGGMAQEKRAASTQQQLEMRQQKEQTICRPVAYVRPRQLLQATADNSIEMVTPLTASTAPPQSTTTTAAATQTKKIPLPAEFQSPSSQFYAKRSKRCTLRPFRMRRVGIKQLNACCVCGRPIVVCIRRSTAGSFSRQPKLKPKRAIKCRKCRSVWQWRTIYMRSLPKDQNRNVTPTTSNFNSSIPPTTSPPTTTTTATSLVNQTRNEFPVDGIQRTQKQCLERPLVDGKVVAMLRRLGTTLSRESPTSATSSPTVHSIQLPPIMSPGKPKPRWTRPVEADEILLHFDTAISEVLPIVENVVKVHTNNTTTNRAALTRRKLTYQLSAECGEFEHALNSIPKELNVSLI